MKKLPKRSKERLIDMKYLNIDKAIQRYNQIVCSIGYEHIRVGTRFSENTENWNIRDMVLACWELINEQYA